MFPSMLPFFDQDHMALRARVREWVGEKLFSPRDQNKTVEQSAVQLVADLASAGFLSYTVTQEFGGIRTAVQARDLCVLREELARGDALADTMFAMQALGSYPITFAGTVSQKQSYLSKVTSGAAIAAFAITEPDAGSDVASMQTHAVAGSTFLLSGTKRFISNAGIANFYIVFASTQPDKKAQGISAFIVEAGNPGLVIKEKTELLSPHPIGVVEFNNCVVKSDALLGQEGEGLQIAFATLDLLRCTVGAAAVGLRAKSLRRSDSIQQDTPAIRPSHR